MSRSLPRRIAGRLYWSLPRRAQTTIRGLLGPMLLARRMGGTERPDIERDWASHRRPVSIVIPSYRDLPFLATCVKSVRETCKGFDYEVIVVDDSADHALAPGLRALEDERVRVVFRPERGGFAKAVNTGIAVARHDVVLLNSDIVARPGWLDALQRAAHTVAGVGMVSGMLVFPDGLIQYGGTYHTRSTHPQWYGHLWVGRPANDPVANVGAFIRSISGACVYVRREVIASIGPLDEEYWLGFEDVDWGLRAWAAGFRCWYEPAAKLIHHESATRGYRQGLREFASMRYFWSRWGLRRPVAGSRPSVVLVASTAAPPLWRAHVDGLAEGLRALDVAAEVVEVAADAVDEGVIRSVRESGAVPVCTDPGASPTAWLAANHLGAGLSLLPGWDPGIGATDGPTARASLRPEFDYAAPSRAVADRLRAESHWDAGTVVTPALEPRQPDARPSSRSSIVTVGTDAAQLAVIRGVAAERSATVVALDGAVTPGLLAEIASLEPRIVVDLRTPDQALATLALMSLGAAFVGATNPATAGEVMDGYNALLVDPADDAALARAVGDLIDDDAAVDALDANARETASEAHAHAPWAFMSFLQSVLKGPSGLGGVR